MDENFVSNTDELVANNARYAAGFDQAELQVAPLRRLAIVACMDSRIDPAALLGLGQGDAHILRNAGGVITDDVIRSLCLSQRFMGTREIVLLHHTDCGLQRVTEDGFRLELESELGVKPPWALESFDDPHADVRQSMERLHVSPFLSHKDHIYGFVYRVETGGLDAVERRPAAGG